MTGLVRPDPRGGLYDDVFWDHLSRRDLRLQRCTECGRFRYPPGPSCPDCLADGYEWSPVSGKGRLLSWAEFHHAYFPTLDVPYVVAAVEIDEGPIMVGNLPNRFDELHLDDRVRVWYEEARTVSGRPLTICQWELDR